MRWIFSFLLFYCGLAYGALTPTVPIPISTGQGNAVPQIAVDPSGNAIVVWSNNFTLQILASYFNSTTFAWSVPIEIGIGAAPQVDMDSSGNAIAVWGNGRVNQIQAARFSVTTKVWTLFGSISQTGTNFSPQISVGTTGNAIAVWLNNFPSQIQAANFDITTLSWSLPVQISSQPGTSPQVGVDMSGNGTVAWQDINTGSIVTTFLFKS